MFRLCAIMILTLGCGDVDNSTQRAITELELANEQICDCPQEGETTCSGFGDVTFPHVVCVLHAWEPYHSDKDATPGISCMMQHIRQMTLCTQKAMCGVEMGECIELLTDLEDCPTVPDYVSLAADTCRDIEQ